MNNKIPNAARVWNSSKISWSRLGMTTIDRAVYSHSCSSHRPGRQAAPALFHGLARPRRAHLRRCRASVGPPPLGPRRLALTCAQQSAPRRRGVPPRRNSAPLSNLATGARAAFASTACGRSTPPCNASITSSPRPAWVPTPTAIWFPPASNATPEKGKPAPPTSSAASIANAA
jgi:hypothetical protein